MKMTGYLIMERRGSARFVKRIGDLRPGEVVLQLNLSVPDSFFKVPAIQVDVDVPDGFEDDIAVDVEVRSDR